MINCLPHKTKLGRDFRAFQMILIDCFFIRTKSTSHKAIPTYYLLGITKEGVKLV